MAVAPYALAKNSNNTVVGTGAISINNADVGYLQGDIKVSAALENEIVKAGTPKAVVAQIIKKFAHKIEATLMETSLLNFVYMFGGDSSAIITWDGSTNYYDSYWTDTLASKQSLTFKQRAWGSLEAIVLDYESCCAAPNAPAIMNTTGVTTYTENTDYIVDYVNGVIWRTANSTIASGATVKVKYKCLPAAGTEFVFKSTNFLSAQYPIQFTQTNSLDAKTRVYYMPLGEITAGSFTPSEDSIWLTNITIEAVKDDTQATYPSGYARTNVNA